MKVGRLVFGEPGVGAAAAPAEFIEACVGGHSVRPGAELGSAIEAGQAFDDGDQRFLGCIESVGVVARQASTDGMDSILMPA